jgi:hypothetical protein
LDGFLSMLSPGALQWLIVAAVFPEPRFEYGIMNTRIRCRSHGKNLPTGNGRMD